MYPPAVQSDRCCSKPIDLDLGNGKTLHVNKGEVIGLPIYNIHHDAEYFPNPEKFDPTRFNDDNKSSIVAGSYLPFGMGQRACIGRLNLDFLFIRFYLIPNSTHTLQPFRIDGIEVVGI